MGFARKQCKPPASQSAVCPKCGHVRDGLLDSAQSGGNKEAQEGDCTVCAKCIAVLVFQSDLTLAEMTEDKKNSLAPEEQAILELHREFTRKYSPFS